MAIFTDDEIQSILRAYLQGTKQPDEDVAVRLIRWAEIAKIDETFVDMLIKGLCVVDEADEEGEWVFSITEKGVNSVKDYREGLVKQLFPGVELGEETE